MEQEEKQPNESGSVDHEAASVGGGRPPLRKNHHLWPWLLTAFALSAGVGFWAQHEAWLDNRWFRSTLINIGIELPMRAKDWRIQAQSLHAKWVIQSDGSKILVVQGRIDNLMRSDMKLPRIQLVFFSKVDARQEVGRMERPIRLAPSERQLHQVPYAPPPLDNGEVAALGQRDFTLVIESIPKGAGNFTLMPVAD